MKNIFRSIAIATVILAPSVVFAQDSISGLEFLGIKPGATIGEMISALYVYGVGFVALAAFVMFAIGGAMYIFAGDKDPGKAREMMKNAFWGLVLALTSWIILYTINPDFVKNIGDPRLQMLGISPSQTGAKPTQGDCSFLPQGKCEDRGCLWRPGQVVGDCKAP